MTAKHSCCSDYSLSKMSRSVMQSCLRWDFQNSRNRHAPSTIKLKTVSATRKLLCIMVTWQQGLVKTCDKFLQSAGKPPTRLKCHNPEDHNIKITLVLSSWF